MPKEVAYRDMNDRPINQAAKGASGGASGREGEVSDLGAVARKKGRKATATANDTQTEVEKEDLDEMLSPLDKAAAKNRKKMKSLGDALAASSSR